MILSDLELLDVVKALSPLQQELGREINPVVMTTDDFTADLAKKKRFASRIMDEQKVFVIGSERDFAALTQDQSAR